MTPDQIATKADIALVLDELAALRAMVKPPEVWLTIEQAAEKAGVSKGTIHRRIKEGSIESTGSGKLRRVRV